MRSMSTANIIDLEDNVSYLYFDDNISHIDLTYRYVRRCGSHNPTIIFIHDCRKTKESWNKVLNDSLMQENYLMYSLDMRGYGKSPCGRETDYTRTSLFIDIHHFITSYNLDKVVLIGEGSGARLIAEYCSLFPNTVIAGILYKFNIDKKDESEEDEETIKRLRDCERIHNYYEKNGKGEEIPLHYRSAKDELKRCKYTNKEIEYLFSEDGEGCHYIDNVINLIHYSVVIGLHPLADYLYENITDTIDIWTCFNKCIIPILVIQIEGSENNLSSIHYRKIKKLDKVTAMSVQDYGDMWPPYKELIKNVISFIQEVLENIEKEQLIDELW